jgi:Uma2 family endonuclease
MSSASTPSIETLADVVRKLGGISLRRIRTQPPLGTATEKDVIRILERENRLYELVDGVLVEKIMGYPESSVAMELGFHLKLYLKQHDLGNLAGMDGTMRLLPSLVRIPDLSFVSWDRLPDRHIPREAIAEVPPDLAVEVLSQGNTKQEMQRKLKEYFLAGTRLVWFVSLKSRTIEVFTSPDEVRLLTETDTLDGGDVLPGFSLPVRDVFTGMPRQGGDTTPKKGSKRSRSRKPDA